MPYSLTCEVIQTKGLILLNLFSSVNALLKILGSLVDNNVSKIILRTGGHMNEWEKAETG